MHPVYYFVVALFIPFNLLVYSQNPIISNYYSATILDTTNRNCLPFVYIFNESQRVGTISDSTGSFKIKAATGDTLALISLGYLGKRIILSENSPTGKHPIFLQPRYYEIAEVKIVLPRTYEQFKKALLELEPEEPFTIAGLPNTKQREIPLLLDTNYLQSTGFAISSPISYLYYNFSKEEQSKRKVQYLTKEEREQVRIDKKFNRELIQRMTGLVGEEITDFIVFCNFSHKYLYEATELEILMRIDQKFKAYQSERKADP